MGDGCVEMLLYHGEVDVLKFQDQPINGSSFTPKGRAKLKKAVRSAIDFVHKNKEPSYLDTQIQAIVKSSDAGAARIQYLIAFQADASRARRRRRNIKNSDMVKEIFQGYLEQSSTISGITFST